MAKHNPEDERDDDGALAAISRRNLMYRKLAHVLSLTAAASVLLAAGALAFAYQMYSHQEPPKYFASTSDGRIVPLVPVSVPMMTNSLLLNWAGMAATEAYSFDFKNWRGQFSNAKRNFTPQGWEAFEAALQSSGNLDAVIQKRMIVTSALQGAGVIIDEREDPVTHAYYWVVEFPMTIVYEGSGDSRFEQHLIGVVTITRVSTLEYERGVAIKQFVTASAR